MSDRVERGWEEDSLPSQGKKASSHVVRAGEEGKLTEAALLSLGSLVVGDNDDFWLLDKDFYDRMGAWQQVLHQVDEFEAPSSDLDASVPFPLDLCDISLDDMTRRPRSPGWTSKFAPKEGLRSDVRSDATVPGDQWDRRSENALMDHEYKRFSKALLRAKRKEKLQKYEPDRSTWYVDLANRPAPPNAPGWNAKPFRPSAARGFAWHESSPKADANTAPPPTFHRPELVEMALGWANPEPAKPKRPESRPLPPQPETGRAENFWQAKAADSVDGEAKRRERRSKWFDKGRVGSREASPAAAVDPSTAPPRKQALPSVCARQGAPTAGDDRGPVPPDASASTIRSTRRSSTGDGGKRVPPASPERKPPPVADTSAQHCATDNDGWGPLPSLEGSTWPSSPSVARHAPVDHNNWRPVPPRDRQPSGGVQSASVSNHVNMGPRRPFELQEPRGPAELDVWLQSGATPVRYHRLFDTGRFSKQELWITYKGEEEKRRWLRGYTDADDARRYTWNLGQPFKSDPAEFPLREFSKLRTADSEVRPPLSGMPAARQAIRTEKLPEGISEWPAPKRLRKILLNAATQTPVSKGPPPAYCQRIISEFVAEQRQGGLVKRDESGKEWVQV